MTLTNYQLNNNNYQLSTILHSYVGAVDASKLRMTELAGAVDASKLSMTAKEQLRMENGEFFRNKWLAETAIGFNSW